MVVVRKEIHCHSGQQRLFDDDQIRYFFYITNESKKALPAREVIRGANRRCNQENTFAQLKACHCLKAPLHDLESNGAYMVFASLAWNLKQWSGMLVQVKGNPGQRRVRGELRRWLVRMEFATYLSSLMLIPGQVIRSARTLTVRLLTYRPTVDKFLTLHDHIGLPLRHYLAYSTKPKSGCFGTASTPIPRKSHTIKHQKPYASNSNQVAELSLRS
jgi:hypothetical protein